MTPELPKMLERQRPTPSSFVVLLSLCGSVVLLLAEQRMAVLPPPPGAQVATLPRRPGDKPQETSVAVNPRDPRNVIVSYQQSIGEGSDHYPDLRLDGHVAWSGDGGKTWTVG